MEGNVLNINNFYIDIITDFVTRDLRGMNPDVDAGTEDIWN